MKDERKRFWIGAFNAMGQVWQWIDATRERVEVWDGAVADLSTLELRHGVARLIAHGGGAHSPTPGDLRKATIDERILRNTGQRGAPLGVLDRDRLPLALPGQAGAIVRELGEGMRPTRPPS